MTSTRREFLELAALFGASAAWSRAFGQPSHVDWHERRDFYPEGVASGDPDSTSVLLWTRREPIGGNIARTLTVEVSSNVSFTKIVASQAVDIAAESDWTCRVLVGGLQPSREYWYRFTDPDGMGSRPGRTITAPRINASRTVRFAFVSCQNVNLGAQNAYRR